MPIGMIQDSAISAEDRARIPDAWEQAWSRATAAWPNFDVTPQAFATHLLCVFDPEGAISDQLEACCADDLMLCVACLQGNERAVRAFEAEYGAVMLRAARRSGTHEASDVVQAMRERLFVGASPKLATFRGAAPLGRWLRVACQRLAIDFSRKAGHALEFEDQKIAGAVNEDLHDNLLKGEYRAAFRAAFEDAMSSLEPKGRTLLRLHLLHGSSIDELATMNNVHRATAARWLAKAREDVRDATRRGLAARLGANHGELDSIMALIGSRLDVTITRHLRS